MPPAFAVVLAAVRAAAITAPATARRAFNSRPVAASSPGAIPAASAPAVLFVLPHRLFPWPFGILLRGIRGILLLCSTFSNSPTSLFAPVADAEAAEETFSNSPTSLFAPVADAEAAEEQPLACCCAFSSCTP
eukprot:TRINITY_DN2663_c0_g1_i3.p5 TRINITY_DN2663_c0_g1~~TRINITY_DN2663_c0_g1_i3.p5  ORF type:complete len:133 (-),score=3.77 TRINITY_DN2663_c0_g1_i3:2112-2510(-)